MRIKNTADYEVQSVLFLLTGYCVFFFKICDSYELITSYCGWYRTLQPLLQGAYTLHQIAHHKQRIQQSAIQIN